MCTRCCVAVLTMLRISLLSVEDFLVYKLEGDLSGDWVNELREEWFQAPAGPSRKKEFVDMSAVSRIDSQGLHLISVMYLAGVRFIASAPYTRSLLDEYSDAVVEALPLV